MQCYIATDMQQVCEYLRRDIFVNNVLLESIENGTYQVIWVAEEEEAILGVMLVGGTYVE